MELYYFASFLLLLQGLTTSTINISGGGTITDLNVSVDITHTFSGDFNNIELEHIDTGTRIVLFGPSAGGAGDNIVTTFDDEAAAAVRSELEGYVASRPDDMLPHQQPVGTA